MTDPQHIDPTKPELAPSGDAASGSPSDDAVKAPVPNENEKLSKEEQMERYEEHLKETDWGHQPC